MPSKANDEKDTKSVCAVKDTYTIHHQSTESRMRGITSIVSFYDGDSHELIKNDIDCDASEELKNWWNGGGVATNIEM